MGRKPIDKVRIDNPELREDWVRQVAPFFFQKGLDSFNMNEISVILDVSKATLYKHYSTHVEVLEEMVDMRVANVAEFEMLLFDEHLTYWERYRDATTYVCERLSDVSALFISDLQRGFPYLHDRIRVLQNFITERLRVFYEEGIAAGFISAEYDPHLLAVLDHNFILQVCEPTFLKQNNLPLQVVINAHFNIKQKGVFKTGATSNEPSALSA
jgi:AcrR family transcriptional regulator